MKTFGILLCSLFLSTLLLSSCSKITVKGENGKEYETYQEACRDNDYNAAHKFLDFLKEDAEEPEDWEEKRAREKKYQDALEYIYTQEMMFLVSEGSDASANRILFLMTELKSQLSQAKDEKEKENREQFLNDQCDKVVDLAASQGNIELVKKVLPMYASSEAQTKKSIQMLPKSDEFIDLAINSLTSYNIMGLSVTEGLHETYYIHKWSDSSEDSSQRNLYVNNLGAFNSLCNQLFDYAINTGNKELAQKVLQLYKQNVVVTRGEDYYGIKVKVNGVKVDYNHIYVQFTWQDKDLAKKRYKEAVANGAFKK